MSSLRSEATRSCQFHGNDFDLSKSNMAARWGFCHLCGGGRLRGTTSSQLRGTVVRIQHIPPLKISRPSYDASALSSLWPLDAFRSAPQKKVESQGPLLQARSCLRTVVHRCARYCGHLALAPVLLPLLLPRAPLFFLQRDSMTIPLPGTKNANGVSQTLFTLGARKVILGVIVCTEAQTGVSFVVISLFGKGGGGFLPSDSWPGGCTLICA